MSFFWKTVATVVGVLGLVAVLCVAEVRCSGGPDADSSVARIAGELEAGKRESRYLQAEELARLAHEFRVLARRYRAEGENRKAQRAIGAAQELDKKIRLLRSESSGLSPSP